MRPTPRLAAVVGGLLTCTMLIPPVAADAKPSGSAPTEKTVSDGTTTFKVVTNPDGGATLSYSLNAHAPWEGYRVAVNGTLGRVELDVVEALLVLEDCDDAIER